MKSKFLAILFATLSIGACADSPTESAPPLVPPIISASATSVPQFQSIQLSADKAVRWNSENEAIATIDESGKVTGVTTGAVRIVATDAINPANVAYFNLVVGAPEAADGTFTVRLLRSGVCYSRHDGYAYRPGVLVVTTIDLHSERYERVQYVALGDSATTQVYGNAGDDLTIWQIGCGDQVVPRNNPTPHMNFTVNRAVSSRAPLGWSDPYLNVDIGQYRMVNDPIYGEQEELTALFRRTQIAMVGESPYRGSVSMPSPAELTEHYREFHEVHHVVRPYKASEVSEFRTMLSSSVDVTYEGVSVESKSTDEVVAEITFRPNLTPLLNRAPNTNRLPDEIAQQLRTPEGRHAYAVEMSRRRKH